MAEFRSPSPNPLRENFRRGEHCPAPDRLAGFSEGRGSPGESSAIARHLGDCAHCSTELALLRRFELADASPEEAAAVQWIAERTEGRCAAITGGAQVLRPKTGVRRLPGWAWLSRHHWRGLSLAAATLAVAFGVAVYVRPTGEPRLAPHAPGETDIWRSRRIPVIAPSPEPAGTPRELAWHPVADASAYHVRLLEVDGAEMWSTDSTAASIELPAGVRSRMQPGRTFLWEAVARDASGRNLGSTSLQKFSILATSR